MVRKNIFKAANLNEGERPLNGVLDGVDLGAVEVGQVGGGEVPREVGAELDVVHLVPEELVVDVRAHGAVVHGELLERGLHAVEARGLPDEVDDKVLGALDGHAVVGLELDADLVAEVVGDLDDVADAGPGTVEVAQVAEAELVAVHQLEVGVVLDEVEVGDPLLVQTQVPAHVNVFLRGIGGHN